MKCMRKTCQEEATCIALFLLFDHPAGKPIEWPIMFKQDSPLYLCDSCKGLFVPIELLSDAMWQHMAERIEREDARKIQRELTRFRFKRLTDIARTVRARNNPANRSPY